MACHGRSGYKRGTSKRGDRRRNWKRNSCTWARATRQQDRNRTWAEGSMLLCQARPQQAAPPLTHLKAASTHNVQGEPSGANSAESVAFIAQLLLGIRWINICSNLAGGKGDLKTIG